jgi:hypothetical protein
MDMFETPTMPAQPIGGSFAWTVPQIMERDDWICRLGEADVAEIDEAVRLTRTRGLAIQEIGRDWVRCGRRSAPASASATSRACRSSATIARR